MKYFEIKKFKLKWQIFGKFNVYFHLTGLKNKNSKAVHCYRYKVI